MNQEWSGKGSEGNLTNHSILLSHCQFRSLPLACSPTRPLARSVHYPLSLALTHIPIMDVLILFISWKINVTAPGRDGR